MVVGAGPKATVADTLVRSCDRYIYTDQGKPAPAASKQTKGKGQETVLVRAVQAAMDEQGAVLGSKLHQTIRNMEPGFDYKALGYSTFVKFLEASSAVKVKKPKGPGDLVVTLANP